MTHPIDRSDELTQALTWLHGQRWFGDKSRALRGATIETTVPVTDAVELIVVRCTFDRGEDARYVLPTRGAIGQDAVTDEAFRTWLFDGFRDDRQLHGNAVWRWSTETSAGEVLAGIDATRSTVMGVEQSNTSIVYARRVMAKLFRRLQAGINPDLEVARYLTVEAGFTHVPAVLGRVELELAGETYLLASLQGFVANLGDGWSWLLNRLAAIDDEGVDVSLDAVGLLGQRTGELHVALGTSTPDGAFQPVTIATDDIDRLVTRVEQELGETLAELHARNVVSDAEVAPLVAGLRARLERASSLVGALQTRVHGDYHLGQVLRTDDHDFAIIDFEGEPSRPMTERREKTSPLKDVAGMVRSLDYAVATSVQRATSDERVRELRAWGEAARERFITRYRDAIAARPELIPDDAFVDGLAIFELEKTLYEVRYELNNRPDWLQIPLQALIGLAALGRGD